MKGQPTAKSAHDDDQVEGEETQSQGPGEDQPSRAESLMDEDEEEEEDGGQEMAEEQCEDEEQQLQTVKREPRPEADQEQDDKYDQPSMDASMDQTMDSNHSHEENGNGSHDGSSNRQEKSLGILTTRFVTLLQEAPDGILDLKTAADTLAVRQKRRIYDITNVLEGIGLIEKKSKNSIKWLGASPDCNSSEMVDRLMQLKEEISELRKQELEIESYHKWCKQSVHNLTDDKINKLNAYVTDQELLDAFPDKTILVAQAPTGTLLEVPIVDSPPQAHSTTQIITNTSNNPTTALDDTSASKRSIRHRIHIKSNNGPVNITLVHGTEHSQWPCSMTTLLPPPNGNDFIFGLGPQEGLTELYINEP